MNRGGEPGGIIEAISRKKYTTNMQGSCNFKSWAEDMNDYLFCHDRSITEFSEYFDSSWIMGQTSSYEEIWKCCANKKLDIDVDSALHISGHS